MATAKRWCVNLMLEPLGLGESTTYYTASISWYAMDDELETVTEPHVISQRLLNDQLYARVQGLMNSALVQVCNAIQHEQKENKR